MKVLSSIRYSVKLKKKKNDYGCTTSEQNFKIKIRYPSSYVIETRFKPLKHCQIHFKRNHSHPDFISRVIKTQKQKFRNMKFFLEF